MKSFSSLFPPNMSTRTVFSAEGVLTFIIFHWLASIFFLLVCIIILFIWQLVKVLNQITCLQIFIHVPIQVQAHPFFWNFLVSVEYICCRVDKTFEKPLFQCAVKNNDRSSCYELYSSTSDASRFWLYSSVCGEDLDVDLLSPTFPSAVLRLFGFFFSH